MKEILKQLFTNIHQLGGLNGGRAHARRNINNKIIYRPQIDLMFTLKMRKNEIHCWGSSRKGQLNSRTNADGVEKVWQRCRLLHACMHLIALKTRRDKQLIRMNPLIFTRIVNNYRNSL